MKCQREGKLLECRTCPRAYHAKCLDNPPDASHRDKWRCPTCANEVSEAEALTIKPTGDCKTDCLKLVQVLLDHELSVIFRDPVDPDEAPGYELFVMKPMSLSEVRDKYSKEKRESFPVVDFLLDLRRVMHNCRVYNSEGSLIYLECKLLTNILETNIQHRISRYFGKGEGEALAQRTEDMERLTAEHIRKNVPAQKSGGRGPGRPKKFA